MTVRNDTVVRWMAVAVAVVAGSSAAWAVERPPLARQLRHATDLIENLRGGGRHELPDVPTAEGDEVPPPVELRMEQCITAALLRNLQVRLALFPERKLTQDLVAARAVFDPVFGAEATYRDSTTQSTSALTGAPVGTSKQAQLGASIGKRTVDGTQFTASWDSGRSRTNSSFATLNPAYTAGLTFEARRSLTQMRGRDLNLAALRQLEHQAAAARCNVHATINDVMYDVFSAFLTIKLNDENLAIQLQSLRQVEELVDITQKRMEVGRAVEAQLIQDQSQLAKQREELIVARAAREQAFDQLLRLISPEPEDRPDPARLAAVLDLPRRLVPASSLDDVSAQARCKRPEVLQLLCQMRSQDLAVRLARDGVKPTFDVVASAAVQGIDGAFPDAHSNAVSLDYPVYTVGLQYSIPLGLRASKSRLRKAQLDREELDLRLLDLEATIELEVRQALRDLASSIERVTAARKTVDFAERSYENEKLLYRQGRTTPYEVNQYRISLDEARLRLTQAKLDYLRALASLRKAEGTLPDVFAEKGTLDAAALAAGVER